MNQVLSKIIEASFTIREVSYRIRILKDYLTNQLFDGAKTDQLTSADLEFINSLADSLKEFNKDNLHQIFEEIDQQFQSLTPLVIYLPVEIPQPEINRLGAKLRQDYGNHFLFEIRFDPSLIAGCALIWKGIYKDYSLKAKIAENRKQILTSFKTQSQQSRI